MEISSIIWKSFQWSGWVVVILILINNILRSHYSLIKQIKYKARYSCWYRKIQDCSDWSYHTAVHDTLILLIKSTGHTCRINERTPENCLPYYQKLHEIRQDLNSLSDDKSAEYDGEIVRLFLSSISILREVKELHKFTSVTPNLIIPFDIVRLYDI